MVLENVMKIGPSDPTGSITPPPSAAQKAQQTASAPATAANTAAQSTRSAGVSVTVSTQVRGLEQAKQSDAAVIDAQKVASVKASIADGSYVVNAEAIADKLLASTQETLARTSG